MERELRKKYFETLFEMRVYNPRAYGMTVSTKVVCKHPYLRKLLLDLAGKYHYHPDYIISESMTIIWEKVLAGDKKFEIRDDGSWEALIAGEDKKNEWRLMNFIRPHLEREIYELCNPHVKRTSANKKKLILPMASLEAPVETEDGEEQLINLIGKSFFNQGHTYQENPFIEWYKLRKDQILTKRQRYFLQNLSKFHHKTDDHLTDDYLPDDIVQVTGVAKHHLDKYKKDIARKILKHWEKEHPWGNRSTLELELTEELTIWEGLLNLIENGEPAGLNKQISNFFIVHMDYEPVQKLIYDNLFHEEIQDVIKAYKQGLNGYIPTKILYKLCSLAEERIDEVKKLLKEMGEREKPPLTPTSDKELNTYYKSYIREFKNQPCHVYKQNEDGTLTLINTIHNPPALKRTHLYEITAYGEIPLEDIME